MEDCSKTSKAISDSLGEFYAMTPLNMLPGNGSKNETPQAVLNRIRVAAPCAESWEAMPGGDRVRACERCQHKVYNLSEMTAEEAARLVQKTEGRLCVRFYQRADGTVMTKDCPVGLKAIRLRIATAFSAVFAAVSLFFSAALTGKSKETTSDPIPATPTPAPVREVPLMGAIAPTRVAPEGPRATMGEIAVRPVMGDVDVEPRPIMGKVKMGRVAPTKKTAE